MVAWEEQRRKNPWNGRGSVDELDEWSSDERLELAVLGTKNLLWFDADQQLLKLTERKNVDVAEQLADRSSSIFFTTGITREYSQESRGDCTSISMSGGILSKERYEQRQRASTLCNAEVVGGGSFPGVDENEN